MIPLPPSHRFDHEAMNTTFHLRICDDDAKFASDIAQVCSETLDLLEGKLSRFLDDSDVSRINHMQTGDSLFLAESTYDCIRQALELHQDTGGLFDITLGSVIEHRKSELSGTPPPITGSLSIHPDLPAITCLEPGRQIDLGGIGKGFALDQLKRILIEWGAESALLSAGASTQLAIGPTPWPVELAGDHGHIKLTLQNQALAASGIAIQGCHIVHPDGLELSADSLPYKRVWLTAATAATADAWSTALILMTPDQIHSLQDPALTTIHAEDENGIHQLLPR